MDDVEDTPPPLVIWEHQISADDGLVQQWVAFPPDAQQTIRTAFEKHEEGLFFTDNAMSFAITFDRSKFNVERFH